MTDSSSPDDETGQDLVPAAGHGQCEHWDHMREGGATARPPAAGLHRQLPARMGGVRFVNFAASPRPACCRARRRGGAEGPRQRPGHRLSGEAASFRSRGIIRCAGGGRKSLRVSASPRESSGPRPRRGFGGWVLTLRPRGGGGRRFR